MMKFGFLSRDSNDENMAHFGALYFDSNAEGKILGYATPQKYLMHLNVIDPMVEVPDPAVLWPGPRSFSEVSVRYCSSSFTRVITGGSMRCWPSPPKGTGDLFTISD